MKKLKIKHIKQMSDDGVINTIDTLLEIITDNLPCEQHKNLCLLLTAVEEAMIREI